MECLTSSCNNRWNASKHISHHQQSTVSASLPATQIACFQTFHQGKVLPQLVEEGCRELLTRIHNQVGKLSISIKAQTKHQIAYPLNSGLLPCLCCINNFMPTDPVEPLIKVWRPKFMIFKFKGLLEPFMQA